MGAASGFLYQRRPRLPVLSRLSSLAFLWGVCGHYTAAAFPDGLEPSPTP